eukprot:11211137-Lingulodinium_polyedra.AAC.1
MRVKTRLWTERTDAEQRRHSPRLAHARRNDGRGRFGTRRMERYARTLAGVAGTRSTCSSSARTGP